MSTVPSANSPIGFAAIAALRYPGTERNTFAPVETVGTLAKTRTSPFETISSLSRGIVFDHAQPGKLAAVSRGWSNSNGTSVYVGTSPGITSPDGASGGSSNPPYGVGPRRGGGAGEMASRGDVTGAIFIPNSIIGWQGDYDGSSRPSTSATVSSPGYASSAVGAGVTSTSKLGARSLADFGTVQPNASRTLDPAIMNLAADPASNDPDLTVEGFPITAPEPASLSVSPAPGAVPPAGGTLLLPLIVVGTGPGDLTSNLTIFTNEGTMGGGASEAFNYLLNPMVTYGFSTAAVEPASLAVLAIGLAGLAGVRARRGSRSRPAQGGAKPPRGMA